MSRHFRFHAALALVSLAYAGTARAEDAPPPCDYPNTTEYTCYKHEKLTLSKATPNVQFQNGLNTGWLGCNGGKPNEPCDQQPSGDCGSIAACIEISMDDSKIDVAMQHDWDVFWPQTGKLLLAPRKRPNGGAFNITYKLKPKFGIFVDVIGYKGTFSIDPLDILNALDPTGTVTEFDASASGSCKFDPFAFDPPTTCNIQQQGDGKVVSLPLSTLGIDIDKYVELALDLVAGTEDVVFTWQTDEITVQGPNDASAPPAITKANPATSIVYQGGAQVSTVVKGKGKISYTGKTFIKPAIEVKKVFGISVNLTFPIDVNAELPFSGVIPTTLNPTSFDINLPDLFVPTTVIDFGTVEVGQKATKGVKLDNSGLLQAKAQISSTEAAVFQPQPGVLEIAPENNEELKINFLPKKSGKIEATIVVKSNDPDTPEQSFKVRGTGKITGEDPPPEEMGGSGGVGGVSTTPGKAGSAGKSSGTPLAPSNNEETSAADGGCGCRTTGGNSPHGYLALAALAALAGRRRRR